MKNMKIFLLAGMICAGILTAGDPARVWGQTAQTQETPVSAVEDLMREHGVLRRLMLIYEEQIRAFRRGADLPTQPLENSTRLIRSFIQDYHERLEEKYIFPQMQGADPLTNLTGTLQDQHKAGRKVIDIILKNAVMPDRDKHQLVTLMEEFIRMYRPHADREDTVLFPAFMSLVNQRDYDRLGEQFEAEEQKLFGEKGFENILAQVEEIEKALGIYDLNQFTPDGGAGEGAGFASFPSVSAIPGSAACSRPPSPLSFHTAISR